MALHKHREILGENESYMEESNTDEEKNLAKYQKFTDDIKPSLE